MAAICWMISTVVSEEDEEAMPRGGCLGEKEGSLVNLLSESQSSGGMERGFSINAGVANR